MAFCVSVNRQSQYIVKEVSQYFELASPRCHSRREAKLGEDVSQSPFIYFTMYSCPTGTAPYAPEGIAEADQFLENTHQVAVVPCPVVQMPAPTLSYQTK